MLLCTAAPVAMPNRSILLNFMLAPEELAHSLTCEMSKYLDAVRMTNGRIVDKKGGMEGVGLEANPGGRGGGGRGGALANGVVSVPIL